MLIKVASLSEFQGSKKVLSAHLEQVDFCVGQVTYKLLVNKGQVTLYANLSGQVKLETCFLKY